jgi:hypothetical protein
LSKHVITKGATSQSFFVWIADSSSTVGAGLTGLVYNAGSLVASYARPGAVRTAISLATQTVTGAFSSGGFVEVDATNMPGLYRFDVPDAVFASGVNSAAVMLKGATNMVPCVMEFTLAGFDLQTALQSVNATQFAGTAYATALAAEVDAFWDEQVDGSVTARQSVRIQNSALAGKASGLATTTAVYRDLADTKDRITATVDANGNRTAVTRDVT